MSEIRGEGGVPLSLMFICAGPAIFRVAEIHRVWLSGGENAPDWIMVESTSGRHSIRYTKERWELFRDKIGSWKCD